MLDHLTLRGPLGYDIMPIFLMLVITMITVLTLTSILVITIIITTIVITIIIITTIITNVLLFFSVSRWAHAEHFLHQPGTKTVMSTD